MNQISIGIIGTGRFGKVLKSLFESDDNFNVKMSSTSQVIDGETIFPLEEVLTCDIVIPAIPINTFQKWLKDNQKVINFCAKNKPNQLWISVSSVMRQPQKWFIKYLPSQTEKLISHPVFGPHSSKKGKNFVGLPWVFDTYGITNLKLLKSFKTHLKNRGIKSIELPSDIHDQIMSKTQFMSFLFGQLGLNMGLEPTILDTPGFKHLLANQQIVGSDSFQLFLDIFNYNRWSKLAFLNTRNQLDKISIFLSSNSNKVGDLEDLRNQIDSIDHQLLSLLRERFKVVKQIGVLKKKTGLDPLQDKRWNQVLKDKIKTGKQYKLNNEFISDLWNRIHKEALEIETNHQ